MYIGILCVRIVIKAKKWNANYIYVYLIIVDKKFNKIY